MGIVDLLRSESAPSEALSPITLRIHPTLEKDIRAFCREHNLQMSVVLRMAIQTGFGFIENEAKKP